MTPVSGVALITELLESHYQSYELFAEFPSLYAYNMNLAFNGYILSYLVVHFKGFIPHFLAQRDTF